MQNVIEVLRQAETELESKLIALRAAIAALGGAPKTERKLRAVKGGAKRKMSAEGRARIAAAARKRWAAYRRGKKG